MDGEIGIGFGEVVEFGDFTGNGDDSVVSEVVDGEGYRYEEDDDPSVPFFFVFSGGV